MSICETGVSENIFEPEWLKFAIPQKNTSSNFLGQAQKFDGCKIFNQTLNLNPNLEQNCDKNGFSQETIQCSEFVYDQTYFDETLATKLNLVCDQSHKTNLLGTILIIGLLFGSLAGGRLGKILIKFFKSLK